MNSPPDSQSLAALQACFAAALRGGSPESDEAGRALAAHVVDDGLEPESRVQVYDSNVRAMFEGALERTFPVLRRRVGEAHFRQLAAEYRARHPSLQGAREVQ